MANLTLGYGYWVLITMPRKGSKIDMDKYRLVEIPPSGRGPPDVGLTRIR